MLADTTNEPRSSAENYASATGASSLKMEAHRTGPVDAIAAAGMSPYQTGVSLMRLMSEWDRAAKPKPLDRKAIQALAATYRVQPNTVDFKPNPRAGLVEINKGGKLVYRKPIEVAKDEADRNYAHELAILAGHMKTLPAMRRELEHWLGGAHAPRIVADVIGWWLEPRCLTCHGSGKHIVHGSGGRTTGKPCFACITAAMPGQRPLPHAGLGRRLLAHIRACYNTAAKDQRPSGQQAVHDRLMAKHHAKVARLRRADDETRGDEKQDRDAASAQFGESFGRKRLIP